MNQRSHSLMPAVWMISAAFCFATMGALTHELGARCDWLLVAFIRSLSTLAFSVALAAAGGARLYLWRPATLWWRSIAGTVSLAGTFYALTRLPVADVLTLTNTYPLWIVLTTFVGGRRGGRLLDLVCVACGVLGVILIQQPHGAGPNGGVAVAIALLASVTTAIAMLGLHRLKEVDPRAVVAHFSGLATVSTLLAFALARPAVEMLAAIDAASALLLLGVGLSGTAGQILLTKAYASGPPSKIAVLSLTQVVFGLGYDLILQDRRLTLPTLVGFVMVLGPTGFITSRAARPRGREAGERAPAGLIDVAPKQGAPG